jgi:hypothetical protein
MSVSQILGIALAAMAFVCFAVAGFEEANFATWVDGAGVSLIIYGLVRAAGGHISSPHVAEDDSEVPKPSSVQEAAPQEAAPQEAAPQEAAPQEAAPQEAAPASLQERIEQLRGRR